MNKTILIVDDSATIRQQVRFALDQGNFEVLEAADGLQGLDRLAAVTNISLVISDINMPNMNGIEMLERINKDARLAALPVVVLTTETQPDLIARAKALGAKGWLVKPFRVESLLSVVKKLTGTA